MPLDWIVPQLPVSLPAKPIPCVKDLAALKARFGSALQNLQETDLDPNSVWKDLFALVKFLRDLRHDGLRADSARSDGYK